MSSVKLIFLSPYSQLCVCVKAVMAVLICCHHRNQRNRMVSVRVKLLFYGFLPLIKRFLCRKQENLIWFKRNVGKLKVDLVLLDREVLQGMFQVFLFWLTRKKDPQNIQKAISFLMFLLITVLLMVIYFCNLTVWYLKSSERCAPKGVHWIFKLGFRHFANQKNGETPKTLRILKLSIFFVGCSIFLC